MNNKMLLQQILSGIAEPIKPTNPFKQPAKNPFIQTSATHDTITQEAGVNRPLRHAMFLGYRDNQAVYAGSRLFVLY